MKNKKIILISIVGLLIIGFFSLYNSLDITHYERGEKDNYLNKKLKSVVPQNIKDFIRETTFESKIKQKQAELDFINDIQFFEFKKNEIKNKKLHNINLSLKTFTAPIIKLAQSEPLGPRSYLSYYNQNLFLITGKGILMFASLNNLKDEKFVFKKIDTNFEDIVGADYIYEKKSIVKNLLIKNKKIYISYEKKVKDKCFTNEILVSSLKFEKIIFNEFFNTNECQPFYDNQVGGNLSDYKDDKILMSIGDYHSCEHPDQRNDNPQNINSLIGKIISIDEKTKEYKILSMGHRNPQGLYYDKENNVIYSTDHGSQGGDEINVNTSPDGEIKNYGWGISSYSEHYGFPDADNSEIYKIAPLNKSHAKYDFIEPIKYFNPAIAPTQIIKTEKFIRIPNKNIIYIGTLTANAGSNYRAGEGGGNLSIHQFILDADLKIEQHNIMPVHERIRDMIYIEELNKIFLFLESSGSIGILEVYN